MSPGNGRSRPAGGGSESSIHATVSTTGGNGTTEAARQAYLRVEAVTTMLTAGSDGQVDLADRTLLGHLIKLSDRAAHYAALAAIS